MEWENMNYWIAMAGVVAFAVTAVLAVSPNNIDVFGACVMGIITAIGGGTIRDVILDVPVFWAVDLNYIWVAIGASLAAFAANSLFTRKEIFRLMLYLDAIGVALFSIQAANKVWAQNFGRPLAPVIMGIITAIGGGLIRDVLAGRQTLLMTRELYAIPVMIGCTCFAMLLEWLPQYRGVSMFGCGLFIFAMRAAVIRWDLSMPECLTTRPKKTNGQ